MLICVPFNLLFPQFNYNQVTMSANRLLHPKCTSHIGGYNLSIYLSFFFTSYETMFVILLYTLIRPLEITIANT